MSNPIQMTLLAKLRPDIIGMTPPYPKIIVSLMHVHVPSGFFLKHLQASSRMNIVCIRNLNLLA